MKSFDNYAQAKDFAIEQANMLGMACGITGVYELDNRNSCRFIVRILPRPENRTGFELTCEVVEPSKSYTKLP